MSTENMKYLFERLILDYPHDREFKKLKKDDVKWIYKFFEENGHLDVGRKEYNLARLFLDNPNKPKSWVYIQSLILSTIVRERIIDSHGLPIDWDFKKLRPDQIGYKETHKDGIKKT